MTKECIKDLEKIDMYLDEIAMNIVDIVKVLGPGKVGKHIDEIENKIMILVDEKILRI